MACMTLPISPKSRTFYGLRCLGVASALLGAAGTLTNYALEGTGLPQLFAVLAVLGIWVYDFFCLHTTWLLEDGEVADLDLQQVRETRACEMLKTWLFFDLAASFVILMPILAGSNMWVLARGVFMLRIPFILRCKQQVDEKEPESSGDIEEARQRAPSPGSVAPEPNQVGRPGSPSVASEASVVSAQAVVVNCKPQAPVDGSWSSAREESASSPEEAAPVPVDGGSFAQDESSSTVVETAPIPL